MSSLVGVLVRATSTLEHISVWTGFASVFSILLLIIGKEMFSF